MSEQPAPGRDKAGRFQPGNRLGRGQKSVQRARELASAVKSAITVEQMEAVMQQLRDMALAGDVPAAALLLQHVCGRPREQQPALDMKLPDIGDAAGVRKALVDVALAAAGGDVELDAAEKLAGLVSAAGDAGALAMLERRVEELRDLPRRGYASA
jgi:hypothetical protein